MGKARILGINVSNRGSVADLVQKVLTNYGCSIRTRLGLNEADDVHFGSGGLIILELTGDTGEWEKLLNDLKGIDGIEVNHMDFNRSV